jgi:3-oxoacyl-(acyl-carrier-protein) synthase
MDKYSINGIGCVSAQDTSNPELNFDQYEELDQGVVSVFKPKYKAYIKPAMIRRMSNGVKMGVVASAIALKDATVDLPDAIITGSGMGCLKDSEKFLENIINNEEQYLTPTSFIQSTHNTVGAQIALGLGCKSYNVTYVHSATSFESSLIDAMLMIDEGDETILVGGVDEIGPHTTEHHKLVDHVKKEEDLKKGLLNSNSKGAVFSEGAQFIVLNNKRTDDSYARLIDVAIYDELSKEDFESKLQYFLEENKMKASDIDVVIMGNNGDVDYDRYYDAFQEKKFQNTQQLYYKQFSGEYNTASAFGLWTACKLFKSQNIPEVLKLNNKGVSSINHILLYNQYQGKSHSFTLLSSC